MTYDIVVEDWIPIDVLPVKDAASCGIQYASGSDELGYPLVQRDAFRIWIVRFDVKDEPALIGQVIEGGLKAGNGDMVAPTSC
ncbi:hypothetical protein SAJA_12520 [Salinisphaera japonica YTM-1]|uniref:Uncharacterized protein n=1 Tax=Salinisphaera japonica YTM-1 TaxID=1209778 RepID=A0A423PJ81_9GAMM|nr:hypothetical protein SAJA_12520 [Salinisphaera japonica YTM-1]